MSVTDEELLLASRADGDRFGELFDRHFATIYRYLHRRVGSDLADELGAETFVRAFQHRDSYDPQRAPVRAWLFGIATIENRAVCVDVFVDCAGNELWYLTLVDEIGLGIIRWNVEPPSAVDVDEGPRMILIDRPVGGIGHRRVRSCPE